MEYENPSQGVTTSINKNGLTVDFTTSTRQPLSIEEILRDVKDALLVAKMNHPDFNLED